MIHPVRNYKSEVECDPHMDILTLRVLRQILRYSKDFLKDKIERKKQLIGQPDSFSGVKTLSR